MAGRFVLVERGIWGAVVLTTTAIFFVVFAAVEPARGRGRERIRSR